MSRVLGGDVYRAEPRNAYFSPLRLDDAATGDLVMAPFEGEVEVLQFHEDTFTIPPGAVPLARSWASGLHQAFRYGERAYAIQFHFEVDAPIVRGWCASIGPRALAEEWATTETELVDRDPALFAAQESAGRELFVNFLKIETPVILSSQSLGATSDQETQ
jgi:GMP synthase-like glutamine amidotransferase